MALGDMFPIGVLPIVSGIFGVSTVLKMLFGGLKVRKVINSFGALVIYSVAFAVPLAIAALVEIGVGFQIQSLKMVTVAISSISIAIFVAWVLDWYLGLPTKRYPIRSAVVRQIKVNGRAKHFVISVINLMFALLPILALYYWDVEFSSGRSVGILWTFLIGSTNYPFGFVWMSSTLGLFAHLGLLSLQEIFLDLRRSNSFP